MIAAGGATLIILQIGFFTLLLIPIIGVKIFKIIIEKKNLLYLNSISSLTIVYLCIAFFVNSVSVFFLARFDSDYSFIWIGIILVSMLVFYCFLTKKK